MAYEALAIPVVHQAEQRHVLQGIWDASLAGLEADAVRMALELGLLARLEHFEGAVALAASLDVEAGRLQCLLELLASMGVLERGEGTGEMGADQEQAALAAGTGSAGRRWRLAPALRPYLLPQSAQYCGDALLYRCKVLRQSGEQLGALLRPQPAQSGRQEAVAAPDAAAAGRAWAAAARLQIAQEQRAVSVPAALALLENVPEFHVARRLLDLGGGPGLVAIALAKRLPALHGVLFEYPEVAAVARENIEQAGLQVRLQAQGGDAAIDDFGGGYDLIWCSSVLHFVPDVSALLARLYCALRPGGVLVCCHAQIDLDGVAPPDRRVLAYYLNMRMMGRKVQPARELVAQLLQAGFASVAQAGDVCFPVAPVTALIARKERQES